MNGLRDQHADHDTAARGKPHTPDVDYLRGAAEALALVAAVIADYAEANGSDGIPLQTFRLIVERAAAELGLDEEAPGNGLSATLAAEQPSAGGNGWAEGSGIESGRFWVEGVEEGPRGAWVWVGCDRCKAWTAELESPGDLAELVRRAGEHTEECR